jgi:hypothetical protein
MRDAQVPNDATALEPTPTHLLPSTTRQQLVLEALAGQSITNLPNNTTSAESSSISNYARPNTPSIKSSNPPPVANLSLGYFPSRPLHVNSTEKVTGRETRSGFEVEPDLTLVELQTPVERPSGF